MEIYLKQEKNKNEAEVIHLPVLPTEIRILSPQRNEVFQSISTGDVKFIGLPGLKAVTLESFFPSHPHKYKFDKSNQYSAAEYINKIEAWKEAREPIQCIITETSMPFNKYVSIENFEYSVRDATGDIYYTIQLEEFKKVKLETRKL